LTIIAISFVFYGNLQFLYANLHNTLIMTFWKVFMLIFKFWKVFAWLILI